MKRYFLTLAMAAIAVTTFADDTMRQSGDTCIVNTTTLCNVRGYRATTPVEVYIHNGKVQKVVALKNQETPTFFERIKQYLLPLYSNLKLSKAIKQAEQTDIDGCTGATFSTRAVQANIKSALEHYKSAKPQR